MDLYRYFHPHHNPRLSSVPVRLQELSELEQAALELKKAVQRAALRSGRSPNSPIKSEHFDDIIAALGFSVESLSELTSAHPGDKHEEMLEMLSERDKAPGWENWVRLLKQRLSIIGRYEGNDNMLKTG